MQSCNKFKYEKNQYDDILRIPNGIYLISFYNTTICSRSTYFIFIKIFFGMKTKKHLNIYLKLDFRRFLNTNKITKKVF